MCHTIATNVQIHDRTNPYVDNAKKPLVLFLKLFLIKDLYGEDALL